MNKNESDNKVSGLIKNTILDAFFIRNTKSNTSKEKESLRSKLLSATVIRTTLAAIVILIITIVFVISDLTSGFYKDYEYSFINITAESILIVASIIYLIALYFIFKNNTINDKKSEILTGFFFISFMVAQILFYTSDLIRNVFSSTIYFIALVCGFIMSLRIIFNATALVFFSISTCILIPIISERFGYTEPVNSAVVSCIVYLVTFLLSSYLRFNFLNSEKDKLELSKLNQILKDAAEKDALTGLYNRRGQDIYFKENLSNWLENDISLGLICIDIDNFKIYNDEFGHPAGDIAIKKISNILIKNAKSNNGIAVRAGGEEMNVILENVKDEMELLKIAEAIRNDVVALNIQHSPKNEIKVLTISLGIASIPAYSFDQIHKSLDRCDLELYNAKENGRNCISLNNKIYR